jgi:hypothetical protein
MNTDQEAKMHFDLRSSMCMRGQLLFCFGGIQDRRLAGIIAADVRGDGPVGRLVGQER